MTDIHQAPSSSLIVGGKAVNGDAGPPHHHEAPSSSAAAATTTTTANGGVKMVEWRGNMVPEKKAKALKHVFDDLQDHFGHQRPDPKIRFSMASPSPSYDHETGVWSDNLTFTYLIDGDTCNLDYIGMDVCIDLTKKHPKPGSGTFDDYGKSWVYVYIPEVTVEKVNAYVKAGTGWHVHHDNDRNLLGIEAKMYQAPQPEPSFWVANDSSAEIDDVQFTRCGSVQEVFAQPDQQRVHRGVGIFAVSLQAPGSSDKKPMPGFGEEAELSLTLISVRAWGVTENVAPIVYSPSRRGS